MSDRPPAEELRRSVAVLATEWWLVVGCLAGYLTYGVWVIGTGLALDAAAPGLATTTVTTVGTTTVTGLVVLAAVTRDVADLGIALVRIRMVTAIREGYIVAMCAELFDCMSADEARPADDQHVPVNRQQE